MFCIIQTFWQPTAVLCVICVEQYMYSLSASLKSIHSFLRSLSQCAVSWLFFALVCIHWTWYKWIYLTYCRCCQWTYICTAFALLLTAFVHLLNSVQLVNSVTGQSLHTSQVNCVAAHENGFLGISGSEDCSAKLINCSTGKVSLIISVGVPLAT